MSKLDRMRKKQKEMGFVGTRLPETPPKITVEAMPKIEAISIDPKPQKPAPQQSKPPVDQRPHVVYRCGHRKLVADYKGTECAECKAKTKKAKPPKKKKMMEDKGRLPDGSVFATDYNASKMEWFGSLYVWEDEKRTFRREFHGAASGVESLLRQLAHQFWESLEPKEGASNGGI